MSDHLTEQQRAAQSTSGLGGMRRSTFVKLGLIAPLAALPFARSVAAAQGRGHGQGSQEWQQVAHDLEATRTVRRAPSSLSIRWRQPIAGGLTGPALVVEDAVIAASLGGEVAAFDLDTGRERWRRVFPQARYGSGESEVVLGFFGGCATAAGRVLVASDRVRCLRLRDGALLWEADPLRAPGADDYFWGAPVVAAGLVIVGSGAGSEATETRGRVSAYDMHDGRLAWSTPTVPESGNGGGVLAPVSVDLQRGAVFAGTGSPYLTQPGDNPGTCSVIEVALRDGRLRWSDQLHAGDTLGLDVNSAPVLTPRVIAVTAKDGVWAWRRDSRERAWHRKVTPATPADGGPASPINGPEGGPLAFDGKRLFALSNDGDQGSGVAAALDPHTGEVRWQSALSGLTFAAPAVAGDALCLSNVSGDLEVLNVDTGAVRGRVALGGPSAGAVSAARGRILVGIGAEPFLPGGELICIGC